LSHLKAFLQVGVKMKVVQEKVLYNFAKKSKAKIQLDFEL